MSAKSDLNKIFQRITDTVENLATSNQLRVLGKEAGRIIKNRTRNQSKGSVAKVGGPKKRLKPLAKSTKDYRTFYASLLHGGTSPKKSNLTFTGQLLDSFKVRFIGKTQVEIAPHGNRKPFRGFGKVKRKRTSATPTNQQVAGYVSEKRPFNFLSRGEQNELVKFYQRTFDRLLNVRQIT